MAQKVETAVFVHMTDAFTVDTYVAAPAQVVTFDSDGWDLYEVEDLREILRFIQDHPEMNVPEKVVSDVEEMLEELLRDDD